MRTFVYAISGIFLSSAASTQAAQLADSELLESEDPVCTFVVSSYARSVKKRIDTAVQLETITNDLLGQELTEDDRLILQELAKDLDADLKALTYETESDTTRKGLKSCPNHFQIASITPP